VLTKIRIKNFKKLDDVDIELGKSVVFIGPNNSGKTTALQALALWNLGAKRWNEKRAGQKKSPEKRPGVTINRSDLISIPTPSANLLWRGLHVRNIDKRNGKQQTHNIRIDIVVDGITLEKPWSCGLEFDYANEESFYCRPLRIPDETSLVRMDFPQEAAAINIAYLPPMSGLAAIEPKWELGRINVLLGEGQTAQVLRNLCYQIFEQKPQEWKELSSHIHQLFKIQLDPPRYIVERGEIIMTYKDENGAQLDLSSSGRGLQQTLLLLSHLYVNPSAILLLDEPDAHLEILRQRQIYQLLNEAAHKHNSQLLIASHSEVVLDEASEQDVVIAFVGKPHRINDRGSQLLKSLHTISFEDYYLAEQTGWVLYLEGATDLSILRIFAKTLNHSAFHALEQPVVHYVANQPQKANEHFFGLREAKPDLVGFALFDRLDRGWPDTFIIPAYQWLRREIENYLCMEEVLFAYARYNLPDDLFGISEMENREQAMKETIDEIALSLKNLKRPSPWSMDIKASDDFLDPLFEKYFEKLILPNQMRKTNYHVLAKFVPREKIDPEVIEVLDRIVEISQKAKPRET